MIMVIYMVTRKTVNKDSPSGKTNSLISFGGGGGSSVVSSLGDPVPGTRGLLLN